MNRRFKGYQMKKLLAILSVVLFANQAIAVGGTTCSAFLEDIEDQTNPDDQIFKMIYMAWVGGFVTGANSIKAREGEDQVGGFDFMLKQYCIDNPLETLSGASAALYRQLEELENN